MNVFFSSFHLMILCYEMIPEMTHENTFNVEAKKTLKILSDKLLCYLSAQNFHNILLHNIKILLKRTAARNNQTNFLR